MKFDKQISKFLAAVTLGSLTVSCFNGCIFGMEKKLEYIFGSTFGRVHIDSNVQDPDIDLLTTLVGTMLDCKIVDESKYHPDLAKECELNDVRKLFKGTKDEYFDFLGYDNKKNKKLLMRYYNDDDTHYTVDKDKLLLRIKLVDDEMELNSRILIYDLAKKSRLAHELMFKSHDNAIDNAIEHMKKMNRDDFCKLIDKAHDMACLVMQELETVIADEIRSKSKVNGLYDSKKKLEVIKNLDNIMSYTFSRDGFKSQILSRIMSCFNRPILVEQIMVKFLSTMSYSEFTDLYKRGKLKESTYAFEED